MFFSVPLPPDFYLALAPLVKAIFCCEWPCYAEGLENDEAAALRPQI